MSEVRGDSFGCPAVTDFRTAQGIVLLTRCSRKADHDGKHNNPRTKSWQDSQTTWLVSPPPQPQLTTTPRDGGEE